MTSKGKVTKKSPFINSSSRKRNKPFKRKHSRAEKSNIINEEKASRITSLNKKMQVNTAGWRNNEGIKTVENNNKTISEDKEKKNFVDFDYEESWFKFRKKLKANLSALNLDEIL